MYIEEEVGRKTSTVDVADWEDAYAEVKDVLEKRFMFDRVEESRFRHHKDKGLIVSRIKAYKEKDRHTDIELTFVLTIDLYEPGGAKASATIDSKAAVVTRYPEDSSWQKSIWYVFFRSLWDKLVYGWTRGRWKDEASDTLIDVHSALRGAFASADMER